MWTDTPQPRRIIPTSRRITQALRIARFWMSLQPIITTRRTTTRLITDPTIMRHMTAIIAMTTLPKQKPAGIP